MKPLLLLTLLPLAAGCLQTSGTFPALVQPEEPTPAGPPRSVRSLDGVAQYFDESGALDRELQHRFEYLRATDETPSLFQVTDGDELIREVRSDVGPSGLADSMTQSRAASDSVSYSEYEWDVEARVLTERRTFHGPPGSDEDELESRVLLVWDDDDVLTTTIREEYDQLSGLLEYRSTNRPFPPTGRPAKTGAVPISIPESQEWLLPDGNVERWSETSFNEQGLPVRTDTYDADGEAGDPYWWAGSFDEQGRVSELQTCDGGGDCYLVYRFIYDESTGLFDRVVSDSAEGQQAMRWLWTLHPLGGAPLVWPYLLDEATGTPIQTPCASEWSTEVRITTCARGDSLARSVITLPQEVIELPEL